MRIVYVIAGNIDEFADWVNKKPMRDRCCYIADYASLKALKLLDPDGVFIGTWYNHPEIYDILRELTFACEDTTKREIINSVIRKWVDYKASKTK